MTTLVKRLQLQYCRFLCDWPVYIYISLLVLQYIFKEAGQGCDLLSQSTQIYIEYL